jgi:hypothetical protein
VRFDRGELSATRGHGVLYLQGLRRAVERAGWGGLYALSDNRLTWGEFMSFDRDLIGLYPGYRVVFKDKSRLQKVIGFLVRPFNPEFMTRFTTVIGRKVYFPSVAFLRENLDSAFSILAHESIHLYDAKKSPGWFQLGYLMPQIMLLPLWALYLALSGAGGLCSLGALLAYGVGCLFAHRSRAAFLAFFGTALVASLATAVALTGWWSVLLAAAWACALPWPSPWRTKHELRAYAMTMRVHELRHGTISDGLVNHIEQTLTGPSYYYAARDKTALRAKLLALRERSTSGALDTEPGFAFVVDFIEASRKARDHVR